MNFEKAPIDKNVALAEIEGLRLQVMGMGANDNETEFFNRLRDQVANGTIAPEEGIRLALEIVDSKQDYH